MDMAAGTNDVSRSRKEALFETLSGILSPVHDVRKAAEERVKALEVTEEFGVHLAELTVDRQGSLPIRQLASVLLKQYVEAHWSQHSEKFQAPETSEIAKITIRQLLPQGINESISKVRASVAYAISAIAHWDWPEVWPELFPILMELLTAGDCHSVHGAMRVLTEFSQEVTDAQMPMVAMHILPEMYKIFMEAEKYGIRTRGRAVTIFTTCASVIVYMSSYHVDAAKTLLYPILPQFTEALVMALQVPDGMTSDSGLKMEIIKALTVLVRNLPSKVASWLPQILPPVWNALTQSASVYMNTVVNNTEEADDPVDSDGDVLGFESLVFSIFSFVTALVESKKFRHTIKQGLTDLMYYIVLYMQMTEEQVQLWSDDPDKFVEDEDDETFSYSVRISSQDLLLAVSHEFEDESCLGLCNAITRHFHELGQSKQLGSNNWWKVEEACMLAIGSTSFIFLDKHEKQTLSFNLNGFLQSVVLDGLSANASPFHTGRCLWLASRYVPVMSAELTQSFMEATIGGLRPDQPPSVRVSSVRAVCGFCDHLKSSNHCNLIGPFLPHVADGLFSLASQFGSATEVLALIMETINVLICVDEQFTRSIESKVSPLTIAVFLKYNSDPTIVSITQDIFKSLCQNKSCIAPLQERLLPTLDSILNAPSTELMSGLQIVALDILQILVRNSPVPLPEPLINRAFSAIIHCIQNTDDRAIMQSGGECLRAYSSCDIESIIKWRDASGNSGLSHVVQIANQLLNPNASEFTATFVGRLVSTLISKAGPTHLGDSMDLLLKAVLSKMQRADTLTVIQSLVMVFALLIHSQLEAILDFLSRVPGPTGGSALEYVLTEWCSKQHLFFGSYVNKVSTIALCKILEHGILTNDSRLTDIQVKGDPIFNPSSGIKTRSKASQDPEQWSTIPVLVKIFKLIVNELYNIQESNMAKASSDDEDDDEDEGWEDEEMNLSSAFAPASDYFGYDADVVSDDEDDLDAKADPIYHVNIENNLVDFLKSFIQQPFYSVFSEHLNDREKMVLANMSSATTS